MWTKLPYRIAPVFMLVLALVFGCAAPTTQSAPTPVPPLNLTAYATATLSLLPTATPGATDVPVPTPTPSTYIVVAGDSLGTIAEQFNLRLADLQDANPGVISTSLYVGQKLNIPASTSDPEANPTPIPADLPLGQVYCYPSGSGLWCLGMATNSFDAPVENVSAQISLVGPGGEILARQMAFPLLNVIPPGTSLPLATFFPEQYDTYAPSISLQTAILLLPGDTRYLKTSVQNLLLLVEKDGRSATVQGQVSLPDGSEPTSQLWLAVTAYDALGQPVGTRRWETISRLSAGNARDFSITVYSVGGGIDHVEVQAEARP